jgi:hypothetical protein
MLRDNFILRNDVIVKKYFVDMRGYMNLWNNDEELKFFKTALGTNYAVPEKLFYQLNSGYYTYIPKNYNIQGQILQSRRDFLIGRFSEKWARNIFKPIQ